MAHITNKDILNIVSKDMIDANNALLETASDRFNRNVLNLIQEAIKLGKGEAQREQHKDPDSRMYVYVGRFPLAVYEGLTPDFLKELEDLNVTIYRKENLNTAHIKIVYRF